jgi:hypothetical protein
MRQLHKMQLETEINKHEKWCQLKKLRGEFSCSLFCALVNDCPVFYIDEHEGPIIKKEI